MLSPLNLHLRHDLRLPGLTNPSNLSRAADLHKRKYGALEESVNVSQVRSMGPYFLCLSTIPQPVNNRTPVSFGASYLLCDLGEPA